jgi:hypothetical protein
VKGTARVLGLAAVLGMMAPAGAAISYGIAGSNYGENFNALAAPASATTTSFVNDSTISGLYAFYSGATSAGTGRVTNAPDTPTFLALDNYLAPTATTGSRVYSYGAASAADRAFGGSTGSTARNLTNNATPGDYYYALVLQNTTGSTLSSFTLSYAGEQWAEATAITTNPQTLRFDFLTMTTAPALADIATPTNFGSYVNVPTLNFVSPQNDNTGTAAVRDGNDDTYRDVMTDTVPLTWGAGEYLVLRFFDDDSGGNDHGLGIDDVVFSAAIPEPASLTLLIVCTGAALRRCRGGRRLRRIAE